jgi:uncharacterized protein YbjQ (UPF0145 family)
MTLGNATLAWADLFLASGAVINFNNGDVTITHSSNALAFAGASSGYSFDAVVSAPNVWRVVGASAVAQVRNSVNGAGDAVAQTMATINIPANTLGANGIIRVMATWSSTNSANAKTVNLRFGGTAIASISMVSLAQLTFMRSVQNRNSTSSQLSSFASVSNTSFGGTTNAIVTSAIDTTASQDITLTCLWSGATSGETITLEGYTVEVCNIP